jgi:phosphoribosylamine--glycine ligase
MKVLIVGSGGREHAIAWKMSQSEKVTEIYCAPGNPGTARLGENIAIAVDALEDVKAFALEKDVDLVVIGPEYPLTLGMADLLREAGLRVFGPGKTAATLEGSKSFSKEIMDKAGVLTAKYESFTEEERALAYVRAQGAPIVLKADGLAAGKGVFVCQTLEEAEEGLSALFGDFEAKRIVVEEFLEGKEVSYIVATNGTEIIPLAASHDYKRIFDNDGGPNTGGMGTVSPTPNLSKGEEYGVLKSVMRPVVEAMAANGTPYQGFLYAGLMIAPDRSVKVLEFNARLGDPETQVILRRMESDLFELLYALSDPQGIEAPEQRWADNAAVCVVLASKGYPETSSKGDVIDGIEAAEEINSACVFHAGTAINSDGHLVTGGGRVLNVTAMGATVGEAREMAYRAAEKISFEGLQKRSDIAA